MFWIYNLLLALFSPIWVPLMILKSRKRKEPVNWKERQGDYSISPRKDRMRIWIHAVSVGEVIAALPILKRIKDRAPEFELVLTATTSSGYATAEAQAKEIVDHLAYFPIDVVRFQIAAMSRVTPCVVATMETELWMNFLSAAEAFGAETAVINGRLSDRSYPRAKRFRFFYRSLLAMVGHVYTQTDEDARRFRELGAQKVETLGNSKFDQAAESGSKSADDWRTELKIPPGKPVVVIGSTRGEEEEAIVMNAISEVGLDKITVIHAPRHMERVPDLATSIQSRFGAVAHRSKGETGPYIVLDTYGELASLYALADVAIIGGGFAPLGGQNILQALAHGVPVIHGKHMHNFTDIVRQTLASGASKEVENDQLGIALNDLLNDQSTGEQMSKAAKTLMASNLGAADRYADAIVELARASILRK